MGGDVEISIPPHLILHRSPESRWNSGTLGGYLGWKCRRHVADMLPTRRNVAYFRPDGPILAT